MPDERGGRKSGYRDFLAQAGCRTGRVCLCGFWVLTFCAAPLALTVLPIIDPSAYALGYKSVAPPVLSLLSERNGREGDDVKSPLQRTGLKTRHYKGGHPRGFQGAGFGF